MRESYRKMLSMPRPRSRHTHMTRSHRAKQFAPFAALKGFEETVDAAGSEYEQTVLNEVIKEYREEA